MSPLLLKGFDANNVDGLFLSYSKPADDGVRNARKIPNKGLFIPLESATRHFGVFRCGMKTSAAKYQFAEMSCAC